MPINCFAWASVHLIVYALRMLVALGMYLTVTQALDPSQLSAWALRLEQELFISTNRRVLGFQRPSEVSSVHGGGNLCLRRAVHPRTLR